MNAPGPVYGTEIPETPGYYVYRLWAGDACLYVGRVGDSGPRPPQPRLKSHRRTREWWPQVTRVEIAELPDHPAMVAEEEAQIERLHPRRNVQRMRCTHDRSLPGVVTSNGECRVCANARKATPQARAAQRATAAAPARRAKKKQYDIAYRPTKNAAKRLRRRAPGAGQGGLW